MELKLAGSRGGPGVDLENPRQCAAFLFGFMIFYMAIFRMLSLLLTFSINLISIVALSGEHGLDLSRVLLAFQPALFDGLELFEQLRLLVCVIFSTSLTLYLAGTVSKIKPRYVFPSKRTPLPAAAAAVFLCTGFAFIGSWLGSLLEALANLAGIKFYSEFIAPPVESAPAMVLFFLSLVLVPALFEEFLIRGLALSVTRRFGALFWVVLTSVMFALMHGTLTSMVQALFFSLAAGFVVMRFENVWITVCAHALVNLSSFVVNTVMQTQPSAVYADVLRILTGVVFLLFIAALVYSLLRHRQFFTGGYNLTDWGAVRVFLTSPVAIAFFVLCVFLIVVNTFMPL